jgi:hypothetical protein
MASVTVPEFSSAAFDAMWENLNRLEGLAACCASLTHADAAGTLKHQLTDKALYELALAMQKLARESLPEAQALWDQYIAARDFLQEASHG